MPSILGVELDRKGLLAVAGGTVAVATLVYVNSGRRKASSGNTQVVTLRLFGAKDGGVAVSVQPGLEGLLALHRAAANLAGAGGAVARVVTAGGKDLAASEVYPSLVYATTAQPVPDAPVPGHWFHGHSTLLFRGPSGDDAGGHFFVNLGWWIFRFNKEDGLPLVRLHAKGPFKGPAFGVHTGDPGIAKTVFQDSVTWKKLFQRIPEDGDLNPAKRCPLPIEHIIASVGRGMFLLDHDDPRWGISRRVLNPAMGFSAMKGYYPAVLAKANELMHELDQLPDDTPVDVYSWMSRITFDSIALCGFGIDLGNVAKGGQDGSVDPFLDGMRTAFKIALQRVRNPFYGGSGKYPRCLAWTKSNRAFEQASRLQRQTIQQCIDERKAGRSKSVLEGKDLLDLMLEGVDPLTGHRLPEDNIPDQISNFLIAGHETTSSNITQMLYLFSIYPKCQDEARREAREVLGDKSSFENKDVARLKYIDACLHESLRLFPPVSITPRVAFQDTIVTAADGRTYLIPKFSRVVVNKHALHMNTTQWGPQPWRFDPMNWLDQERVNKRHPGSFAPFGGGDRQCIGQQFSLMEAKLLIAMLLDRFEFRHIPGKAAMQVNTFTNGLHYRDERTGRIEPGSVVMTLHKQRTAGPRPPLPPPTFELVAMPSRWTGHLRLVKQGPFLELDVGNQMLMFSRWALYRGTGIVGPVRMLNKVLGSLYQPYLVTDPEIVRQVYGNSKTFQKVFTSFDVQTPTPHGSRQRLSAEHLISAVGRGMFLLDHDDPRWGVSRRLLNPAMGYSSLKGYFPAVLKKSDELMAALDQLPDGAEMDVYGWMSRITFDSIALCGFGIDLGNVKKGAEDGSVDPFLQGMRTAFAVALKRTKNLIYGRSGVYPWWLAWTPQNREFQRAVKGMRSTIERCIEERKAGRSRSVLEGKDMLDIMLESADPVTGARMTDSDIADQISNFLIAGHETTSTNITQVLYLLSTSPECAYKALQEAREVLGNKTAFDSKDMSKLKYIDACLHESLRLFPPVSGPLRVAFEDAVVEDIDGNRYMIPKNSALFLNNHALHSRADQWGLHPERFDPEHWLDPQRQARRHPDAWHPFGGGDRQCIGQQFSLMEAKLLVAMILDRFELRHLPGRTVAHVNVFTNGLHYLGANGKPEPHSIHMTLHKRKGSDGRDVLFYPEPTTAAAPATASSVFGLDYPAGATAPAGAVPEQAVAAADSADTDEAGAPDIGIEAPGPGCPVLVLYGSNMGSSEGFAHQIAAMATKRGFKSSCRTLDAQVSEAKDLPRDGAVVVVASTYNGTPPDNAAAFAKWMKVLAPSALDGVKFAVFGTGNKQWKATFQLFPKQIDAALKAAGASRLCRRGASDADGGDFEETFTDWLPDLFAAISGDNPNGSSSVEEAGAATIPASKWEIRLLSATEVEEHGGIMTMQEFSAYQKFKGSAELKTGPALSAILPILQQRELQGEGSDRSTVHVEVELPADVSYEPGEHLEVTPENHPDLVDAALKRLGLEPLAPVLVKLADQRFNHVRLANPQVPVAVTAFLRYIPDLTASLTRRTAAMLSAMATSPDEKQRLAEIAAGGEAFEAQASRGCTILEVLLEFPSVQMPLDTFIAILPQLKPRYYSISSSPLGPGGPRRASITVGQVRYRTGTGRLHHGLASTLVGCTDEAEMERRRPQKARAVNDGKWIIGMVKSLSTGFRLPTDLSSPIIMVGPGTGIAPMMGFLQHREAHLAKGQALGPAILYFGFRKAAHDYLYKDQLEAWAAGGKVLTTLRVAASREGAEKRYVQDLVRADGAALWPLLKDERTRVYICGDAKYMAPDVRKAFKSVAALHGGKSEEQAEWWLGSLLESGRYLEDVWASS